MAILSKHFGSDSWIIPSGDDLIAVKLPESEGRILYAHKTTMAQLGFWMAYVLPGKSFDASSQEMVLAALYQKDGEQFSFFYKLNIVKQIQLKNSKIFLCESSFLFPPVKAKELEKVYINKLIMQMADEYQKIQGIFLENRYEEALEELDILINSQDKTKKTKLITS
jgi:hypothetical protein